MPERIRSLSLVTPPPDIEEGAEKNPDYRRSRDMEDGVVVDGSDCVDDRYEDASKDQGAKGDLEQVVPPRCACASILGPKPRHILANNLTHRLRQVYPVGSSPLRPVRGFKRNRIFQQLRVKINASKDR